MRISGNILRFSAAAILLAAAGSVRAEVIDKIVVVVNNEVVTQREIDRMLIPLYEQYRSRYQGQELVKHLEDARQGIIDQLIEDRLLVGEAKRLNIEADPKEIDARVDEIRSRVGSREQFEAMMREQGLSESDLRKRYAEKIIIRKIVDQKVGATVVLTPVEVKEYYDAHKEEFVQPEQVKLYNILIKPNDYISAEKADEMANTVLKRIREGGDFATLAREYSQGPGAAEGGLMGYVKKGDLMPELESVIFGMEAGSVSDVIKTEVGYHILKVEEKRERKILTLSEIRRDVEDRVYSQKARKKLKDWIEGLKKNAYIAFK